jgi:hypothetical protein
MVLDSLQLPASQFDITVPDVTSSLLHNEISKRLGVKYLEDVPISTDSELQGIVWGPNCRVFVPMKMRVNKETCKWVPFLVETGTPHTYLSLEVRWLIISPLFDIITPGDESITGRKNPRH